MGKVLIIGAGGVGTVVAHKMAELPEFFSEIMLTSRTKSKCDSIAARIGSKNLKTAQINADDVPQLVNVNPLFSTGYSCKCSASLSGSDHYGCLP